MKMLFHLWDNELDTVGISGTVGELVDIDGNTIRKFVMRHVDAEHVHISENTFDPGKISVVQLDSNHYDNYKLNQQIIEISDVTGYHFSFDYNTIISSPEALASFHIKQQQIDLEDNVFGCSLFLYQSTCSERLKMLNNHFDGTVCLNEFVFSETFNSISWPDLDGKLASISTSALESIFSDEFTYDFNMLGNEEQLEDSLAIDNLFRDYYQLYLIFKQNGHLKYANASYSAMKDLETKRASFIYQRSGKINDWFRWKLGQLLKTYTENGTDPARALTISVYIIILFGILYFFYPSDWDVTSKTKLLENFKSAINRQERGTWKSIIKTILLLALSLINAITLSLNSFVTLGFGNIPTHGLARYVCIIQGFIGWFLLSLFTVALINQVLF
jgi:hypothetical protein